MEKKFKTILYDVDTQKGFMKINGGLPLLNEKMEPVGAMDIAANLEHITKFARERNIPILGSVDWHNKDSKEFSDKPDFQTTFPAHCIKNTWDAENIEATRKIHPLEIDWNITYDVDSLVSIAKNNGHDAVVFRKDNFNVFANSPGPNEGIGNPYAKPLIEKLGVKRAIVYGVATDVCNNFALRGLAEMGIEVYALTDAMKGVTPMGHEAALQAWSKLPGVQLAKTKDLLEGRLI